MRTRSFQLAVLAATLAGIAVLAPMAGAHSKRHHNLTILHPWTPEGSGPDAIVSMKIKNQGPKADRLTAVTTSLGEAKLSAAIEILPNAVTPLSANGAHIVISGLKGKLTGYDRIPMVLTFETRGAVEVEVMVEPAD